ncbi:7TM diverse intracellular signaling domain-containing protein [Parachryseolinea silvisoli]|uniref:7TM diverse intracellular signaling domain-containing protein n=1 Tax=Parachryseolinea silvisoli TaxID=2873601 RepID=UPI002265A86D|nr:7TM diverse intracellular signaling domain-containing protein [Parachryseolinea silvisoli]MCD9019371.1 transposase [Parachryseolinea silvisoli]
MRKLIALAIGWSLCYASLAQPAVALESVSGQHIFSFQEIQYLEDLSGKLTIQEVSSPAWNIHFNPSATFNPENKHRNAAYWHRVKVKLDPALQTRWVIEFFDQTIDSIEFFIPTADGGYVRHRYGDHQEFSARPLKHKNFVIPIANDVAGEVTYYFRLRSAQQAEAIVVLRSTDYLFEYATDEYFFFGIFYGMILVFSFYNLLMYAAVRESHYLLYMLYLVGIGVYEMSADGIAFQYIWPRAITWNQYAPGIALYLASTFALFFAASVLTLRREAPGLFKLILGAFVFRTIFLFVSLFVVREWFAVRFIEIVPFAAAFYAAAYRWAKGYSAARFLVIGYSILLFGVVSKVSLYFDFEWMPFGQLSHYSLGFCFIMEMLFLSFAISDKIRLLRIEKAEAQEKTIEQLHENQRLKDGLNQELEEQVRMKTAQLVQKTELIEEQNHRLEEANVRLARQAEAIAAMNTLLARDNDQLKHDVAEVKEARIMSKEVDFEEFSAMYPDDDSCLKFLADIKWHHNYACRKCGHTQYSTGKSPYSRRCSKCGYDESVTAYTVLQNTRLPINKAFYMIFLVYSSQGNISSHKLSEILGIRQSTCWTYSSRIKKTMKERRRHGGLHLREGWNSILVEEDK